MPTRQKAGSLLAALAVLILVVVSSPTHAIVFDFESLSVDESGTLSSITMTVSGLTVVITRTPAVGAFEITDDLSGFVSGWGERTLSPFNDSTTASMFVANFSAPVEGARIELGDFGGDSDEASLRAYDSLDGTGTLLGSDSKLWGTRDLIVDAPDALQVVASGIRSITFTGGSGDFPTSLYWDNLSVVPEPGFGAMLAGLGVSGAALLLRRRRR